MQNHPSSSPSIVSQSRKLWDSFSSLFKTDEEKALDYNNPNSYADDIGRKAQVAYWLVMAGSFAVATWVYYMSWKDGLGNPIVAFVAAIAWAIVMEFSMKFTGQKAANLVTHLSFWKGFRSMFLTVVFLGIAFLAFRYSLRVETDYFQEVTKTYHLERSSHEDTTTLAALLAGVDRSFEERFEAIQETRNKGGSLTYSGKVLRDGQKTIQKATDNEALILKDKEAHKAAVIAEFERKKDLQHDGAASVAARFADYGGIFQYLKIALIIIIAFCLAILNAPKEEEEKEKEEPTRTRGFQSLTPVSTDAGNRPPTYVAGFGRTPQGQFQSAVSAPPLSPETPVATTVSGVSARPRVSETRVETHVVSADLDSSIRELLRAVDQYIWKWNNPGNGATETISRNLTSLFGQINDLRQLGDGPSPETNTAVEERWAKWVALFYAGRPTKKPART